MAGRLEGKVAFITGAAGGIGAATTKRFVEEGASVVMADIDDIQGPKICAEIGEATQNPQRMMFIKTDVSDAQSVQKAIAAACAEFGHLDILHNNAGGSSLQDGPVTEAPIEEFWRVMNVDLFGTFLCAKYALPIMMEQGGGSIINMASNVALMAFPGRDCYTAAKGGVAAITRSMAAEYAPYQVRVNAIAPSITLTDRVKNLLEKRSDMRDIAQMHLLGLGEPLDVAHMAVYLASDESRITTGQILSVDSGVTIS